MIRKLFFSLLMMAIMVSVIFPDSKELQLKLPFRVYENNHDNSQGLSIKNLNIKNVSLFINNQSRPITDLIPKKRSFSASIPGSTADTGRAIVLSFDVSGNATPLIDATCQWVQKNLRASDHLTLRTPLDTYKIDSKQTEKAIQLIRTILQNDLLQGQRDKNSTISDLNNLILTTEQKLDKKKLGIRSAMLFATHFHEGWRRFFNRFLIANLKLFSDTATRFAEFNGDTYVIHFQELSVLPIMVGFHRLQEKMKRFASDLPKSTQDTGKLLLKTLSDCENSMRFSKDFNIDDLLNTLLGVNINCNIVFLSPDEHKTTTAAGYETILRHIAYSTGGVAIHSIMSPKTISDALVSVCNHEDFFFDLVWNFNGITENKSIQIAIDSPTENAAKPPYSLFYKNFFKKEEFKFLMQYLGKKELSVSDVAIDDHKLAFSVSGYETKPSANNKNDVGLVAVEIKLLDSSGSSVYKTANTLQSFDSQINVSLSLPSTLQGYFKLQITVTDTLTMSSTSSNKYIKLD